MRKSLMSSFESGHRARMSDDPDDLFVGCGCPLCTGGIDSGGGIDNPHAPTISFNWDQAAAHIMRPGLTWGGDGVTVTYAFRASATGSGSTGATYSRFNEAQIEQTIRALEIWSEVANINFVRVGAGTTGEGAYSDSATMLFTNYTGGSLGTAAAGYAYYPGAGFGGDVFINTAFSYNTSPVVGGYGVLTLVHEIGHAIGLAHPGSYNAGPGQVITYDTHAEFIEDTRQYSIMSYFSEYYTSGSFFGEYPSAPQLYDIAAAQLAYGVRTTTRTGDTIYGFNSNTGRDYLTLNSAFDVAVFAVWDSGGNDTLDFSGYGFSFQVIDLRTEQFSDVGGDYNNVVIARGVLIENAIGGSAEDTIYGNDAANDLEGRNGDDELFGFAGADTLEGGDGADSMQGGAGANDSLNGGAGSDWASYSTSPGIVTVDLAAGTADDAGGGADTLVSIENAIGSVFRDSISGNGEANTLIGDAGNDDLIGRGGDDRLHGGAGTDLLDGGAGVDWIDYSLAAGGVEANLETGIANNDGDGATDIIVDVENILGSNSADLLDGSSADNILGGGFGADRLRGAAGLDSLHGGEGDDTLEGGAGADYMEGADGDDLYIADLLDTLFEFFGYGVDTVETIFSWILADEFERLVLTGGDDVDGVGNWQSNTLIGNSGDNLLEGGASEDRLEGGAGNDTLDGGSGLDTLIGGLGDDSYVVGEDELDNVQENADEGYDTIVASRSYTLGAAVEALTLAGAGDFNATGNALANRLIGNSGNNVLDGAAGADDMRGGQGDDTYVIDAAGDTITELSGEGVDTIVVGMSHTLSAELENLILTGSGAFNGVGNGKANAITGNTGNNSLSGGAGNDTLDGGAGADTMTGGDGDDLYGVDSASDVVVETGAGIDTVRASIAYSLGATLENLILIGGANRNGVGNASNNSMIGNSGANRLLGQAGADSLQGGSGDDTLEGGAGADQMNGGLGSDTYYVEDVNDIVTEDPGEGVDTVVSSISYGLGADVEHLQLTGSAGLSGSGNALANVLTGNAGANFLRGFAGADTLVGGAGDDTLDGGTGADELRGGDGGDVYYVDSQSDVVIEDGVGGTDVVRTSVSISLGTNANIENLTIVGSGARNGSGNGLNNTLSGNGANNALYGVAGADTINAGAGNDTLDGGVGVDFLRGEAGDDTYDVDSADDFVRELVGGGIDTVRTSITRALDPNAENLIITGGAARNGSGNSQDNQLTGNSAANILAGRIGNDTIVGGAGNDKINGGEGLDVLTGGLGQDAFIFDLAATAANVDSITDYNVADDIIHLDNAIFTQLGAAGALNAAFFRVGSAPADANDFLYYNSATGALYYDANANAAGGAMRIATLSAGLALTAADFLVI